MYKEKYQDLGKFSSHERGSLILISLTIMAILLRNPVTVWGWGNLLTRAVPPVILTDSTIVALATLIGFVTPKCGSDMLRGPKGPNDKASFTALVGWKAVQKSFPWGILIIIGAQTAIAGSSSIPFHWHNKYI
jgi:di/tricarboxylate transporter